MFTRPSKQLLKLANFLSFLFLLSLFVLFANNLFSHSVGVQFKMGDHGEQTEGQTRGIALGELCLIVVKGASLERLKFEEYFLS